MADIWANSVACDPRATIIIIIITDLYSAFRSECTEALQVQYKVLPLGEFTVTILEPHATLQGAVTWRNQCRDRATLQGVRILSAILKIVFGIFWFCF